MLRNRRSQNDSIPLDELKEYFECPVCLSVPRSPPIFQCKSGHMICSICRPKVSLCPLCRSALEHDRLRFAERLLEKVPRPCLYGDDGCLVDGLPTELADHEKKCPFGPINCENKKHGCKERLRRRDMTKHQKDCDYHIISCPFRDCPERKITRFGLLKHLESKHYSKDKMFIFIVILCVISLLINFLLLYSM